MVVSEWYKREESPNKINKALKKLGLNLGSGAKHDFAVCPKTGAKTMIPRHNPVSKPVVESICKFLLDQGYNEGEIRKALKWK